MVSVEKLGFCCLISLVLVPDSASCPGVQGVWGGEEAITISDFFSLFFAFLQCGGTSPRHVEITNFFFLKFELGKLPLKLLKTLRVALLSQSQLKG